MENTDSQGEISAQLRFVVWVDLESLLRACGVMIVAGDADNARSPKGSRTTYPAPTYKIRGAVGIFLRPAILQNKNQKKIRSPFFYCFIDAGLCQKLAGWLRA